MSVRCIIVCTCVSVCVFGVIVYYNMKLDKKCFAVKAGTWLYDVCLFLSILFGKAKFKRFKDISRFFS